MKKLTPNDPDMQSANLLSENVERLKALVWRNATDNNPTNIATEHEYVLVVAREKEALEAQWKTVTSDIKDVLFKMGYRFPKETMDRLLDHGKVLFGEDETKIIELKVHAADYQEKLPSVFELDGRLGAYDLKEDFPEAGKVFNNPKPVRLLTTFFSFLLRNNGDTVVDFFAGSGSTGKTVLDMNKQDGGNRRFILVQLPEPTGQKEYPTIAEVTKERIRRVIKKLNAEEAGQLDLNDGAKQDRGFRVFKLDASNLKPWDSNPEDLNRTMLDHVDHILPDRSEQDLLFELLLKLGLELTVPMATRTMAGKAVHAIGGGTLLVCLAEEITRKEVEPRPRASWIGGGNWPRQSPPPSSSGTAPSTMWARPIWRPSWSKTCC
ncbi:MAG: hypothetical protein HQL62_10035, partial [Magnetococcales bacterium]|nr:hypothetical protein [Magnetococcales bacterium]